jgi:hypothetical protein
MMGSLGSTDNTWLCSDNTTGESDNTLHNTVSRDLLL